MISRWKFSPSPLIRPSRGDARYGVAQFVALLGKRGIEVTRQPLRGGHTFASLYRRAE